MDKSGGRRPHQKAGQSQQPLKLQLSADIPNDPNIPDMYAEGVAITITYNSVVFVLNKGQGTSQSPVPIGVVRMSPQQAYLVVQLLRKALKQYEVDAGKIPIPEQILKDLDIEREL